MSILQKAVGILKKLGFKGGEVDTCLFVHKSNKEIMFIALYVYDDLMIRDTAATNEVIQQVKHTDLVLKIDKK